MNQNKFKKGDRVTSEDCGTGTVVVKNESYIEGRRRVYTGRVGVKLDKKTRPFFYKGNIGYFFEKELTKID
jgi:hypothetical protein